MKLKWPWQGEGRLGVRGAGEGRAPLGRSARARLATRIAGTMIRPMEDDLRSFLRSLTATALAIDGGITL